MEKLLKDKAFLLGVACGVMGALAVFKWLNKRHRLQEERWSNKTIKKNMLELIGYTPVVRLDSLSRALGNDVFIKLENQNPGRSNKDRAARHIIEGIIKDNKLPLNSRGKLDLQPGQHYTIYEGTSGNTGISLGLLSKYFGFEAKIYLNDNLASEKYKALEVSGCTLMKGVPTNYADNGHFVKRAKHDAEKDPNGFYSDQFNNPYNWTGHYNETGPEIVEQMGNDLDVFVMSAGTGATVSGISKYLKDVSDCKVVLGDPKGSSFYYYAKYKTIFTEDDKEGYKGRHPHRTMVEGVGQNWLCDNVKDGKFDDAFRVTDYEALNIARYMIKHEGLLIGSSSAVNLAALIKYCMQEKLQGKRLLTIQCDDGFRHISKFYSPEKWDKQWNFEYKEADINDPMDLSFITPPDAK